MEGFTLENMFAMDLDKFQDIAKSIITNAVDELAIESDVKKIAEVWKSQQFTMIKHFKGSDDRGYILGSVDELNQVLEDNIINLQSMAASRFIGPFLESIQELEMALRTISEVLELWIELQKKWLYLEGIFIGGDIRIQLPEETRKFDEIDKAFKQHMFDTAKRLNVYDCCMIPQCKKIFNDLIAGLDKCQKSLIDYLTSKRIIFPRFNFLSDDELLRILGSNNLRAIQENITKMFDNLEKFQFENVKINEINVRIMASALISCENEIMNFNNLVATDCKIEDWMSDALEEMKRSNRYLTKKAVYDYGKVRRLRTEWMLDFQGMIILVANQIWWTAEVENVFKKIKLGNKRAMKEYLQQLNNQLDDIVRLMNENTLMNNDRKKLDTVLTIDVHTRDIIDIFVRDNIMDVMEFEWESQLRFYWIHDLDNVWVNQCTGSFEYGYEYMGLNGRLVITPLTNRIYLTITQALSMYMGGAPAGPAGTGKTETVKDLAKAFGQLCIVTNCSESMDYISMANTLGGLVQCGVWGCFDEFNRIDVSVLSVISTQLHKIRSALQIQSQRFMFENQDITIDSKVGIFITMNPGYAGKTELPESVKALFRPVVCIVPDNELICQIKLFSAGFLTANQLAKKMTVLYTLAKEQLSKQTHYDFGLRALKSVLNMAGQLKKTCDKLPENVVLMRALRDINLPKLIFNDIPLFLGLIKDLFPGLDCPRVKYPNFTDAVEKSLQENEYILMTEQIDKIIQLHEIMMTRHSTMIVGPTGGGKTVIIETLCKAQTLLNKPTKLYILNPKACTVAELYGVLDPLTRDWTDGILSHIFREINRPIESSNDERRYILFDGDVDALWIENMNSVMDDNKILTLANQERIKLQYFCSLLFEVGDLEYASPATVSRVGMVYVDPKNLGYKPYMNKWINSRCESEREFLNLMFEKYVHGALNLIIEGMLGLHQVLPLKLIIKQTPLNMVCQLCHMIDGLYPAVCTNDEFSSQKYNEISTMNIRIDWDKKLAERNELIEVIYIQSCYYSLGASLITHVRTEFDGYMKKTSGLMLVEDTPDKLATFRYIPITFCTLYDYILDINCKHPILLVGETGTSKTAIIQNFLRYLDREKFNQLAINFSSRTTSIDVQRNIESVLEKRTKDLYGPPLGKTLVVFIDDMNMPFVDIYGTQQPIALLKFLFQRGGLYNRGKNLNWKQIKDISYLAAMGITGGGRNDIDPRFIAMFSIYNATFPSDETLNYIYTSILAGHFEIFPENIQKIADILIRITLQLYKIVTIELPPTPSKFHYIFNMRDLSRIIAGFIQSTPNYFSSIYQIVRLWRNEITRVICDRLINDDDQTLIHQHLELQIKSTWKDDLKVFEYSMRDPLLFGDFRNACNEDEPRYYEDLLDYEAIYSLFMEIHEKYNEKYPLMNMVLFNDALEHLTRIHRALRMHCGHALIIGIGGTGKRSVVKLASFTADCQLFEISLNRGYNEKSFREDMKKLYNIIGIENKKIVFLFTDSHIVNEDFLEMINNMLMIGIIPALFNDEEIEVIIGNCRNHAIQAGHEPTRESIWAYFIKICNANLHIALTMSPSGDNLRSRCRNYPGIVNSTTIDWMFPWPHQALHAVANVILRENNVLFEQHRDNILQHIVQVHVGVSLYTHEFHIKHRKKIYITPKHFLDFINTFSNLLIEKQKYINSHCNHLSGGLEKIAEASRTLIKLNEMLAIQQIKIEEQTKNCEELFIAIGDNTEIVTKKQKDSIEKREEIETKNKTINKESTEAKAILAEAQPSLDIARLALNDLDKSDITEIQSFSTPPEPVQLVYECIAIIQGLKDISWKTAKGIMSDPNFLRILQDMDIADITIKQQQMIKSHLEQSNKLEQMKFISKAGYGLYKFVLAVLDYCTVYREVNPKIERVRNLEIESVRSRRALEKEEEELKKLEVQMVELNAKYEVVTLDRRKLQEETNLLQQRLIAADKLINGLTLEKIRWAKELQSLRDDYKLIIGNCLLSASFISYIGPFSYEFRNEMIYDKWQKNILDKNIPISQPYRIENQLTNDVEISKWNSEGLPSDELSIQNGILTMRSLRFPLCIDPQQQAFNWIKKREAKNNLKIITFNDSDFIIQLEMAIKFGFPILIHDVDYIDPIVDNIMAKNIINVDGRSFVILGDKEVDYDPKFKMYLTTKLSNPIFNPSIYSKATIINYMVTITGLENQLLSVTVKIERPDIEEQREGVIAEISENKRLLQQLEINLLREIAMNKDNILDNIDLIETLEDTKTSANEVTNKILLAEVAASNINKLRDEYRPVAHRGAILFFVLADISVVNPMYHYSLISYLDIFIYSLKNALSSSSLFERLSNIINVLTEIVYNYGCMGIFERHKLLFSFQICVRIQQSIDNINQTELDFFINGNVTIMKSQKLNPCHWLPASRWDDILKLTIDFPEFSQLCDDLKNYSDEWQHWYELDNPESVDFPCGYSKKLKTFQKLMLMRCFRIDRVYRNIIKYINEIMGMKFITPPNINFNMIFEKSTPTMPILLILSPGSDPTLELMNLSERLNFGAGRFKYLSLGQGQEKVIPPPNGLKLNLKNTYFEMSVETLENCNHPIYKHLVYVLAFFHAVIQERRKYDKIGWNINYDFNKSDFTVCTSILDTYLTKSLSMNDSRVPWNSLKYLIGEVMYGGRVIDSYDRQIINTYMDEYFGDFLIDTFQPFHFYHDNHFDYIIPSMGDNQHYIKFIDQLPLENSPEVFGLHSNAEIGYFTKTTKEMWMNLMKMQPRIPTTANGISRDELVNNLAEQILDKIPNEYNMMKIKKNFGLTVTQSVIVLFQELERFNKLINTIKSTLTQLKKAIDGEIGIDNILENIYDSIYDGTLPKEWATLTSPTRKNLAGWMGHFTKRVLQYNEWANCNEPTVIWLSGLDNPQTYLAALVQMACRKNNWPLDKSVTYTAVTKFAKADEVEEKPDQGCYVQGLYLEGARWDMDEQCLKTSYPKVLIEKLPILTVTPIESHRLKLQNTIKTPVYTTSNRRNAMGEGLVFEADLNTNNHVSLWILQGICLILNTD
ncbi:hypothetical protein PV327_007315 [Microctonus hyperodae]|uniref:AAA+ ATPase domain-containing protein n=1 Tax=Microctonus hyperodae TaxID=165561 RepID=A0AA39F693_MICHY|nr:hypothetical protein PV327_007315 [Microctonus hyperodae]